MPVLPPGAGLTLYFVRHGESEANLLKEFSNRPGKHPLTEKGRRQAAALAGKLRGASIEMVYASPVLRALQTAEVLSHELGIPYRVEDDLREFDVGILEGKSDQASWDIYWEVVNAWFQRREWDRRIEGGESFLDIERRFLPFIRRLVQDHGASSGSIALVGHGGTYRCVLPLLFQNVTFDFVQQHGLDECDIVVGRSGPDGMLCLSWGETQLGMP